jgi:hypothetical protein
MVVMMMMMGLVGVGDVLRLLCFLLDYLVCVPPSPPPPIFFVET